MAVLAPGSDSAPLWAALAAGDVATVGALVETLLAARPDHPDGLAALALLLRAQGRDAADDAVLN